MLKAVTYIGAFFSILACKSSITYSSKKAGINGGFEVTEKGLPVNWVLYTPTKTNFKYSLDSNVVKEGNYAFKFDINQCSSRGGVHSPGFTSEFFEVGKYIGSGKFKISFWAKNKGTLFQAKAGGVSAHSGNLNTLIEDESVTDWKLYVVHVVVPKNEWLRMEFSFLKPGICWIDGIKIDRLD